MAIPAFLLHWTWTEVSQLAGILVVIAGLVGAALYGIKGKNEN